MSGVPSVPAVIERTDALVNREKHVERPLDDVAIENFRPYKVIVIGAGYSGINCAIRIPEKLRNVELTVYEKNSDVGGTWFENRYPGCACDIPAHSYQYSYAPNPGWSGFYAPSEEIHAYLRKTCDRFSASRFIKLNHRVEACTWDQSEGKWNVAVRDLIAGQAFVHVVDSVISARGTLNDIQWPEIEGLRSFQGKLMHSASWDPQADLRGKTVGVIGGGSSAIQIVPQLQKLAGTQLKCFVRSKTWISQPFGAQTMANLGLTELQFTDEQKASFANDKESYHRFRKTIERDGNSVHFLTVTDSAMQKQAREHFQHEMKLRLGGKPEIAAALIPDFAVGCRRLTPGEGYLEALQESNVEFINTRIQKINAEGVVLVDGRQVHLDVLVCATGFRASKSPPFPITGRDGQDMGEKFLPFPKTYMSIFMDGFPNFFSILGPNSLIGTGSLTMILESEVDYIVKCIRKLQKENIRSIECKRERVEDFSSYVDQYFKQSVYLAGCSSWYRNEGGHGPRVTGLWPGSSLHAIEALRSPRWEDFHYEYERDASGSPVGQLQWLGNGWTDSQRSGNGDLAFYLEPEWLEVPEEPLPETTRKYQLRPFSY